MSRKSRPDRGRLELKLSLQMKENNLQSKVVATLCVVFFHYFTMSKRVEISIGDILNYLENKNRPLIEGEALYRAGHIILCGIDGDGKVKSLCLQTSALNSLPHEIEIDLSSSSNKWTCKCTCKAGQSGFCKHVIGTLIYINRHEELEPISCTDVTQSWGKEKKKVSEKYAETEVEIFCHKPKKFKPADIEVPAQIEFEIFSEGVQAHPTSAIGSFMIRSDKRQSRNSAAALQSDCDYNGAIIETIRKSTFFEKFNADLSLLRPCCLDVINSLEIRNDDEIFQTLVQGTAEWHKLRELRITGSKCYSLLTFSKSEEWEQKARNFLWPPVFHSKFTNHGKKFEGEAIKVFEKTTHSKVVKIGFIICKKFPWFGYSPDGIVFNNGKPTKLLEVKCPYSGKDKPADVLVNECKYLVIQDGKILLKKRHPYYAQVQLGMLILNLQRTDFIVYSSFSKSYIHVEVNFDEEFATELLQTTSEKYFTNIVHVYCMNK